MVMAEISIMTVWYIDRQEKTDQRFQEHDEVMSCLCSAPCNHEWQCGRKCRGAE